MTIDHSVRKNFRLTLHEASCLARHAADAELTESAYVRTLVCDPAHVFITDESTLRAIYRELKRQGTNLNQIAYVVNAGKAQNIDTATIANMAQKNSETLTSLGGVLDALEGRS